MSSQEAYMMSQDQAFVPAFKSAKRQVVDFELSTISLSFSKIFSPSAIARRSYLFLQNLTEITFGSDYYTNRVNLQSYLLMKTTSGVGELTYLGKVYKLHVGDVILLDCRLRHYYRAASSEGWGYVMAHFDGVAMQDYYNQIIAGGNVCFKFTKDGVFDGLLHQLF